jgi:hypothetical protein
MKLYADLAPHRARQLVGDLGLVAWIVLCVWLATVVHDATLELAVPGREIDEAGTEMAERLRDAGSTVGEIPLVGDGASTPFEGAGASADRIAAAGRAQVEAVETLATWLGVTVALIPILIVAVIYLPLRIRFVRRATAGQRFLDSAADLDLFALRAMTNQPLHILATVSPDPAEAWRRRDPDVVRRLAVLELKDYGLRPPPGLLPA